MLTLGLATRVWAAGLDWVRSFGAGGAEYASGMTTDGAGNVYVTGYFRGQVDFDRTDPPEANVDTLTSNGDTDVFVLKLDPNGGFVWVRSIGGSGTDQGLALTTNASRNLYLTGLFVGSADVDPSGTTVTLSSQGGADVFALSLDLDGTLRWARAFGAGGDDRGFGVGTISPVSAALVGAFKSTVDFDRSAVTPGDTQTSAGADDAFVTRISPVADVGVTGIDSPDPIAPGAFLTYAITAQNLGLDLATTPFLSVPLPAGTTFVSVLAPAGWSCDTPAVAAGGTVTCAIPAFAVGDAVFSLVVQIGAGVPSSTLTSTVTLNATAPVDPVTSNNSVVVETIVTAPAANTPPVNTVPGSQTTSVNTPKTFGAAGSNAISVADADAGAADVRTTLGVTNGTLSLAVGAPTGPLTSATGNGTPTLVLTGTTAEITAALEGLTYTPPTSFSGSVTLTVTTNDLGSTATGGALQDQDAVQITVSVLPTLSVNDPPAVAEGDAGTLNSIVFTVTLAGSSVGPATVSFTTANGATAPGTGGAACTAGIDYATTAGTLTFTPPTTSQTITVPIRGDTAAEGNETFLLTLSAPTNAVIADGEGTGTIADDDGAGTVSFSAATASVPENAGSVTLTVQRSGGAGPTATGTAPAATGAGGTVPSGSVAPAGSVRPNPPPGSGVSTPGTVGASAPWRSPSPSLPATSPPRPGRTTARRPASWRSGPARRPRRSPSRSSTTASRKARSRSPSSSPTRPAGRRSWRRRSPS